jgi:hypothetical protein
MLDFLFLSLIENLSHSIVDTLQKWRSAAAMFLLNNSYAASNNNSTQAKFITRACPYFKNGDKNEIN